MVDEEQKLEYEVCPCLLYRRNGFAGESYEANARYYLREPAAEEKAKTMLVRLRLNRIALRDKYGAQVIYRSRFSGERIFSRQTFPNRRTDIIKSV